MPTSTIVAPTALSETEKQSVQKAYHCLRAWSLAISTGRIEDVSVRERLRHASNEAGLNLTEIFPNLCETFPNEVIKLVGIEFRHKG